jgi:hypothetical protein
MIAMIAKVEDVEYMMNPVDGVIYGKVTINKRKGRRND